MATLVGALPLGVGGLAEVATGGDLWGVWGVGKSEVTKRPTKRSLTSMLLAVSMVRCLAETMLATSMPKFTSLAAITRILQWCEHKQPQTQL